ncbi:MAG: DUF2782 domain-containing protein [Lysobacterales bacterium]
MKTMPLLISAIAMVLAASAPQAQEARTSSEQRPVLEDAPPPPLPNLKTAPKPDPDEPVIGDVPLPPKARTSQELVPSVRITTDDEGRIIEEYSNNGAIYMVKVTPKIGPPYYLIDADGDGEMETRDFESDNGIKPVHWKLLEWE